MSVTLVGVVGTATSTVNGANSLTGLYGQTPTAGHLLVARVTISAVTSVTAITTATTGWTKAFDVVAAATTTAVFTKIAVGSDAGPVLTATSSGTTVMTSVITEYLGADLGVPIDPGHNSYTGTTATAVSLSHSTAVARPGGVCLTMYSIRRNTAVAQTGPPGSGFTADYTDGASLQRNHAYGDHETTPPAQGATPSEAFTINAAPEVQSGVIFVIQADLGIPARVRGRNHHQPMLRRLHTYNKIKSQAPPVAARVPVRSASSRRSPQVVMKRSRVRSTVVTVTTVVPPTRVNAPTWHQVKSFAPRRGKLSQWYLPIAYGPNPPTAPDPTHRRVRITVPVRRGHFTTAVPAQAAVTVVYTPKRRAAPPRHGRQAQPVLTQTAVVPSTTLPDSTRRRVRFATARRGRLAQVVPPQVSVVVSAFVPDSTKRRVRAALVRRPRGVQPVPPSQHGGTPHAAPKRRAVRPPIQARGKHRAPLLKQFNPPIVTRPDRNSGLRSTLGRINRVRRYFIALGAAPFAHPPLNLGGTATDHIINGTAVVTIVNGTSGVTLINGTESTLIYNGTALVVDPQRNGTVSVTAINGTVTETSYNATEVAWGMIAANLTLGEFDDSSVNLAFTTSGGGALDLTAATVDVYLKTAAGVLDTDASTKHYSSTGGSPAITITNPTGGLATVQIPQADIVNASLAFWKASVTIGGKRNTAMFGTVTTTLL